MPSAALAAVLAPVLAPARSALTPNGTKFRRGVFILRQLAMVLVPSLPRRVGSSVGCPDLNMQSEVQEKRAIGSGGERTVRGGSFTHLPKCTGRWVSPPRRAVLEWPLWAVLEWALWPYPAKSATGQPPLAR